MSLHVLTPTTGSITVVLLPIFLVTALLASGITQLFQEWNGLIRVQLRIDRCVAQTSLELKKKILFIEKRNQEIRNLRGLIPLSPPQVQAGLRKILWALALIQKTAFAGWEFQRVRWLSKAVSCLHNQDHALPLPGLPYQFQNPDLLGPQPMKRTPSSVFIIHLKSRSRKSTARVSQASKGDRRDKWIASWTSFD